MCILNILRVGTFGEVEWLLSFDSIWRGLVCMCYVIFCQITLCSNSKPHGFQLPCSMPINDRADFGEILCKGWAWHEEKLVRFWGAVNVLLWIPINQDSLLLGYNIRR